MHAPESREEMMAWVRAHAGANPAALRLKYAGKTLPFPADEAILQVECRRRFGKKLVTTLDRTPDFIFPTALSGEQCTSDALAARHAMLAAGCRTAVDLTAGLGIDAMALAAAGLEVTAVERDARVAAALEVNAPELDVVCADCRDFVAEHSGPRFDLAFIDPARRAADGGRVFSLADCEPDVVAMLPQLRRVARRLVVKMSPMLDITHTLGLLPGASDIIALGTATECKELVAVLDFDSPAAEPLITAATAEADLISFTPAQEAAATQTYALPAEGMWVYEPLPPVMKAAPFALLCQRFGVTAIAPNTHVYLSQELIPEFPGHARRVAAALPYSSGVLKRFAARWPRADVAARNFPVAAAEVARKLRVRAGESPRVLAVTAAAGEKMLIVSERPS